MATTPTPLTWNTFVEQIGILGVLQTEIVGGVAQGVDAYFTSLLPQAIGYAELRAQRDLDLLASRTSNTYTLSAASNLLIIPVGDFVTLLTVAYPFGSTNPPLLPVTQEWLQNIYSTNASNGPPQYFAMIGGDATTSGSTSNLIQLGPTADQNYTFTVFGTIRMPSLYTFANSGQAGTSTTFLSTFLPDLILQAACIYLSQFQRNFQAASNDPSMPGSYENQYQTLLKGALRESTRAKFWGSGWSSESPAPTATPGR